MNIAYFGSPDISADLLEGIIESKMDGLHISLVATQPDKPAGKKLEIQETKVKQLAKKNNLNVFDKRIIDSGHELANILTNENIVLGIVYAYGGYIPQSILKIPKYGFINIHPSLLPSYRGPSPIAYPLIMGDKKTGVSLIQLNEEVDGGDIISQEKTQILDTENRLQLEHRLTNISIKMTRSYIQKLMENKDILLQSQEKKLATSTKLITKNDGYISLPILKKSLQNEPLLLNEIPRVITNYFATYPNQKNIRIYQNSASLIYNYYRGLYNWPGLWTTITSAQGEKRLKLTHMSFTSDNLSIDRVQIEGKNEVDFKTFNTAYKIFKSTN